MSGKLRIWADAADDGIATRNKNSVVDSGDFVPSGVDIDPAKLGLSSSNRTVTLHVEGINVSAAVGDQQIKITADVLSSPQRILYD